MSNKPFDPREQNNNTQPKQPATPKEKVEPVENSSSEPSSTDLLGVIAQMQKQAQDMQAQMMKMQQTMITKEQHTEEMATFKAESEAQRRGSVEYARTQHMTKSKRMIEIWNKQPKTRIYIPLDLGEKKGARLTVIVNGAIYIHTDGIAGIPKARYVEIPEGVANIVVESLDQQIENMGYDERIDTRTTTSEGVPFDPERLNR